MKWGSIAIAAATIIALSLWAADIASDRNYKLEVLEPISLLKDAPQSYPETNLEVAKIQPGEVIEVRRMGYGKDFRAWQVRNSLGTEGWFIENGKNVRVVNPST
jgi:hypothetical protein